MFQKIKRHTLATKMDISELEGYEFYFNSRFLLCTSTSQRDFIAYKIRLDRRGEILEVKYAYLRGNLHGHKISLSLSTTTDKLEFGSLSEVNDFNALITEIYRQKKRPTHKATSHIPTDTDWLEKEHQKTSSDKSFIIMSSASPALKKLQLDAIEKRRREIRRKITQAKDIERITKKMEAERIFRF